MNNQSFTVRFVNYVYKRFGAAGLLCIPFCTMTFEKVCYDTVQAYRGYDIYTTGPREGARGGFPSGGSSLPSFSLIPVQKWPEKLEDSKADTSTETTSLSK